MVGRIYKQFMGNGEWRTYLPMGTTEDERAVGSMVYRDWDWTGVTAVFVFRDAIGLRNQDRRLGDFTRIESWVGGGDAFYTRRIVVVGGGRAFCWGKANSEQRTADDR